MTKREIKKEIKRLTKITKALAKANFNAFREYEDAKTMYRLACKGDVHHFTLDRMEKKVEKLSERHNAISNEWAKANNELINLTKMIKK